MELTGACLKDFEKYRLKNYPETELEVRGAGCTVWEHSDESMLYGVYEYYFDSVGIEIEITKHKTYKSYW